MIWIFPVVFWAFFLGSWELEAKLPTSPHGIYPSDYHQFWFLYESETKPGQNQFYLRPFWGRYEDKETAYSSQSVLLPLYYREETNHWYVWSFLFLFTGTGTKHVDVGDDEDFVLAPFLFWGKGETVRERYFAFFPLAGRIKNKFSYQEMSYFLFPLYSSWKHENYNAYSLLWPFFMRGSSPVRDDIRIFPFYSHKIHPGKYNRQSVLWPFFQWGEEALDKKDPRSYGMFFPFFLWKNSQSGEMKARSILWLPILGGLVTWGEDKKTTHSNYSFLFFVFQRGTSEKKDYDRIIFFPFAGYSYFANKESWFVTPFYFQMRTRSSHVHSDHFFLIPVFTQQYEVYPNQGRTATYSKLWPLYRYYRDPTGNLEWNTLTFFPLRSEVVDRFWDPIFSIVEYRNSTAGEKQFSLLFRLFTRRWSEDKEKVMIPLLTDWETGPEKTEWKFFYGLLGYEKTHSSGERNYQFLWLLKI